MRLAARVRVLVVNVTFECWNRKRAELGGCHGHGWHGFNGWVKRGRRPDAERHWRTDGHGRLFAGSSNGRKSGHRGALEFRWRESRRWRNHYGWRCEHRRSWNANGFRRSSGLRRANGLRRYTIHRNRW